VCPYWHLSSSGVTSREQGLHLGAKLGRCQLGHPYSGNISKASLFQISVDHLWRNDMRKSIQ